MQQKDIEVDEDLPNFYSTVKLSHADEVLMESENMKNNYSVEIELPTVTSTLNNTKIPKRATQRTPWYNILNNSDYTDAFYYIGAHIPEREKLIMDQDEEEGNDTEQSDIVMLLLNLGSIPDQVAQNFNFIPGFQREFLKHMAKYK